MLENANKCNRSQHNLHVMKYFFIYKLFIIDVKTEQSITDIINNRNVSTLLFPQLSILHDKPPVTAWIVDGDLFRRHTSTGAAVAESVQVEEEDGQDDAQEEGGETKGDV